MNGRGQTSGIEVWAGVECTINRVGDNYFDQGQFSGHDHRLTDLDLIAGLGVRTVRYPVLWERISGAGDAGWAWACTRLDGLAARGIRPIVGLVHHGSGPTWTNLLDEQFATGLAAHARAVAERFAWVDAYTPVNEPFTTARFSGLYGHWYPHRRDEAACLRMLMNECRASVLAMQAIRQVNPGAAFVQTEDVGRIEATTPLRYQADFENERRWLGFDLLCGRVSADHPLWSHLLNLGIRPEELAWFCDHPCPPDLIGLNYYITSERFLDHRLRHYPAQLWGGNGRHRYADVEAVRVLTSGIEGPGRLLEEAWHRYGLPLAITEVHLGCTREEQLRWFEEIYKEAGAVRARGADVRAVTAWAAFGSYDWHTLLTRLEGRYEPGLFDARHSLPRPTALARLVRARALGEPFAHPALAQPGWWHRPERLLYPAVPGPLRPERHCPNGATAEARPLLITGGGGTLARAFARACEVRSLPYRILARQQLDIAHPQGVERVLDAFNPWAVINTAGYVRVDEAERDRPRCLRENTGGALVLARACQARDMALVTFSSDLVFDGERRTPYLESDPPAPLNVYGLSKARAERRVLALHPGSLVVRTSAFFGPWDAYNFVTVCLKRLASGEAVEVAGDLVVSPTYVPHLVDCCLDLLMDGASGLWHLSNAGALSWADFARRAAHAAGVDSRRLVVRPASELSHLARRPAYSALGSERGQLMVDVEQALHAYVQAL